jgi:hypothetical protein
MAAILSPNAQMVMGDALWSQNGLFQLLLQQDGNLVLYRQDGVALWQSGTAGQPSQYALMQNDGNFVIYGPYGAIWQSGTAGYAGAGLLMQDDGNVVIYFGQTPVWQSNTSHAY